MKLTAPIVLASALLSACATAPEIRPLAVPLAPDGTPIPNCVNGCDVLVFVPPRCGPGGRVVPDPVIAKKGTRNEITWHLFGRWKFHPTKGIQIHEPERAFSPPELLADGKKFKVVLDSPAEGVFKYDVNLIGPDGRECKIDPTAVNW